MSSTEENVKQPITKESAQSQNPAKNVTTPNLSVKHQFSLDDNDSSKK